MSEQETILTHHALLVVWGQYARATGLVTAFEKVPLAQKTVTYPPQTKVIEFLVAILGGLEYLKDLSLSAHPLDQDQVVAQAWGQPGWADHSGVSRTLHKLSGADVAHLIQVTEQFSQPFIEKEVTLALASGRLELDGDHSPRPVSDTSQTYEGAAYGHMDQDRVGLGFQAEIVSLSSPTYGRIGLSVVQRSGNTISCTQALALVEAAERRLGRYPRRRTELLSQRIEGLQPQREHWRQKAGQAQKRLDEIHAKLEAKQAHLQAAQQMEQDLQAAYQQQGKASRPTSQLAKASHQVQLYQQRLTRCLGQQTKAELWLKRQQANLHACETVIEQLQQRLQQFETDNRMNATPIPMVFRLDSGFGTVENMALLIEMGYEVYSKPYANWLSAWIATQGSLPQHWQRVGDNAEMVAWKAVNIQGFPYLLDLAIERFWVGEAHKLTGMLHFGVDEVTQDLPTWFHYYNSRQTIEAANRESKQVFEVHHLKVRSRNALQLQEQFVLFAANFIRFASLWLAEQCPQIPDGWKESTRPQVKQQVKVGAHTSAYVSWKDQDCLLRFSSHSVFAGRSLFVRRSWAFQPVLPILKSFFFAPI